MTIWKYTFVVLFFTGCIHTSIAQKDDFQIWTTLEAEKKWNDLSIDFSQETRFIENVSETGKFISQVEIQYKIIKNITFGGGYRFTKNRELENDYSNRHRLFFDLGWKYKISKSNVILRLRFQSNCDEIPWLSSFDTEDVLRLKARYRYKLNKKYTLWTDAEMYLPVSGKLLYYPNNMRYSAGLEYHLFPQLDCLMYYMFEHEFNVNNPNRNFILGIGLDYQLGK